MCGCQFLGAEFDPMRWNYSEAPTPYCGKPVIEGKNYCHDHYYVVYQRGTSVNGKRREKEVEKEIAERKRQQELEEMSNG